MRRHVERINKTIEILFYALFLTVPLAMFPDTSELFELNKMWLVYIYCLVIFFLWGTKMVMRKRFEIRRTPFDIPLLLFVLSQVISTIFSLDPHTSFWGYYSRFNGGLLSTFSYVFLYFAFATNILTDDKEANFSKGIKMLASILFSGILVALWGLPSHFGYDPTCFVFRGTLDVSCWTNAFQPMVRMFSTMGQPNWLAAFFLILLPIATAFTINSIKQIKKGELLSSQAIVSLGLILICTLFYLDMGWTLSQSGFIGFWIGDAVFFLLFLLLVLRKNSFSIIKAVKQRSLQAFIVIQVLFVLISFFTINPIPKLQQFDFQHFVANHFTQKTKSTIPAVGKTTPPPIAQPALEESITNSGKIRLIVWRGALRIWRAYPLFGSGVETFAFAYYKFRPAEHNLTSEWDYLYNKAHNEFLNYLATTGAFGLGTYLLFLGSFLFFAYKYFLGQWKRKIIGNPLLLSLIGAFVGIQVSNFFGFSVVVTNLLMFLIPLFYWIFTKPQTSFFSIPKSDKEDYIPQSPPSVGQIMLMIGFAVFSIYSILFLINYWNADRNYNMGYNLDRINEFAQANPYLEKAVQMRGGEDLYNNELSVNLAALALLFAQQKDATHAAQFATRAKEISDAVAVRNPNNVVYWKARTRVMYSLAQLNPVVLNDAILAIEKAHELAPTDAKVLYNEALIFDQEGQKEKALQIINQTIKIKKDYRDAYYAKALFLSQLADKNKENKTKNMELKKEAIQTLNYTLKNINPTDQQAKDLLKTLE